MPVFVSLLRGINVMGNKVILMADLKKLFEKLGFLIVTTYIQSGNVVFADEKKSAKELEATIKDAIKRRFKFDVEVLVLELSELEKIVSKNPFDGGKLKTGERIYFTILSQIPLKEKIVELLKIESAGDEIKLIGKTVYVLCRKGYANSVFNNNFIEKILMVNATTRNLETTEKLVEIGKGL